MSRPPLALDQVARRLRDADILRSAVRAADTNVTGVAQDSRAVESGDLFLAWKGVHQDGHDYVEQAVEAGAAAVVVERPLSGLRVPQLVVSDGRLAGALAADTVLGSPWAKLFLAAVTGTNGKTTVAVLGRHLLQTKGPSRAVGTLGLVEEDGSVRGGSEGLTTPGPVQISSWMRDMVDEGVGFLTLEASSHALAQRRLDGMRFDAAVFTNLTQDHLDYHPDLASYRDAKARLADLLKEDGWALVNGDEQAWTDLRVPAERTLKFWIRDEADAVRPDESRKSPSVVAEEVVYRGSGSRFQLCWDEDRAPVDLPLLGRFNVENALAAACLARVAGMTLQDTADGLARAPQIPGRLERVVTDPFSVLIDFAHTPDALERVLRTLRPVVEGRLLVLFGAGGDRDRGKRPKMGAVVARLADLAIVTSDNPRTEDPETIIDDVVEGMKGASFHRIADRREAIGIALSEARPGDLVLLAGKGHERYQVVGRERRAFVEPELVRGFMAGILGKEPE